MPEAKPSFRLRLRRVRLKRNGATIELLRLRRAKEDEAEVRNRVEVLLQSMSGDGVPIAGFAFVVWDGQGASAATMLSRRGTLPESLIPDFVRSRLLAEKVLVWAKEGPLAEED